MPIRGNVAASLVVVCALLGAGGTLVPHAAAQSGAGAAAPGDVAVDPIRCWWRTDRSAVHIGERFTLTLTCRVVDTPAVTVVPAHAQLEPGAVLVTPFEAVDGRRHEDVVAPPYRFVQYEYRVRFLGEGAFGTDVSIPPLTVTYAVQAASGGGAQGRDRRYVLPAIPMRIVSLVPSAANDIRDASRDTFGAIASHRFRATAALVSSGLLFALAAVLVGVGGVRAFAGRRRTTARTVRPVPGVLVLQSCLRTLAAVRADAARDGWSPALARRAATALRVAGASAMGRPVTQAPAVNGAASDGQILVRSGLVRPRRVLVSAPTTPEALTRHLANGHAVPARTRAAMEPVQTALRTLSAHGYGRADGTVDSASLDAAVTGGMQAIRRLQVQGLWRRPTAA